MADMPRQYFRLPIQPRARLLLALLWSYVPGRRQGDRHFVWHSSARLAGILDVGKRAVESCLEQLYAVGLVESGEHNERKGYWLVDGPAGVQDDSDEPAPTAEARPVSSRSDRRSPIIPVQNGSAISDHPGADVIGDRRSLLHRPPIRSARVKEELELELDELESSAAAAAPAGSPLDVRATAAALLAELEGVFTPRDAAGAILRGRVLLASDVRTLELLTQLLDVAVAGEARGAALRQRREHVRAQILAFASVCRLNAEQARWWGPGMLSTQVSPNAKLSRWGALEKTVEEAQCAAAAREAAQAAADRAQQTRRDQEAREAEVAKAGKVSSADFVSLAAEGGKFGTDLARTLARRMTPGDASADVEDLLREHRRKVEALRQRGADHG